MGDLLSHVLVVAGHNDHRDAVLLESIENRKDSFFRWVKESSETDQRQVMLGGQRVGFQLVHFRDCDSQSAIPVGAQLLEGRSRLSLPALVERLRNTIDHHSLADAKNTLCLALSNEEVLVTVPNHY
jgi:hypothetical protein